MVCPRSSRSCICIILLLLLQIYGCHPFWHALLKLVRNVIIFIIRLLLLLLLLLLLIIIVANSNFAISLSCPNNHCTGDSVNVTLHWLDFLGFRAFKQDNIIHKLSQECIVRLILQRLIKEVSSITEDAPLHAKAHWASFALAAHMQPNTIRQVLRAELF